MNRRQAFLSLKGFRSPTGSFSNSLQRQPPAPMTKPRVSHQRQRQAHHFSIAPTQWIWVLWGLNRMSQDCFRETKVEKLGGGFSGQGCPKQPMHILSFPVLRGIDGRATSPVSAAK
jgi:hypothetical protein